VMSDAEVYVDGPSCPSVKLIKGWMSSQTTLACRHDRLYFIFP
jgi:hypothetical protein